MAADSLHLRLAAAAIAALALLVAGCNSTGVGVTSRAESDSPGLFMTPVSNGVTSVHVTRDPGMLILPVVDETITDVATARRLAADIVALRPFPSGMYNCPVGFGTSYRLVFAVGSAESWWAVVTVLACQEVDLSDGERRWAFDSTPLFGDLGSALGLSPDEVRPRPCEAAPTGTVCYQQPPLPSVQPVIVSPS